MGDKLKMTKRQVKLVTVVMLDHLLRKGEDELESVVLKRFGIPSSKMADLLAAYNKHINHLNVFPVGCKCTMRNLFFNIIKDDFTIFNPPKLILTSDKLMGIVGNIITSIVTYGSQATNTLTEINDILKDIILNTPCDNMELMCQYVRDIGNDKRLRGSAGLSDLCESQAIFIFDRYEIEDEPKAPITSKQIHVLAETLFMSFNGYPVEIDEKIKMFHDMVSKTNAELIDIYLYSVKLSQESVSTRAIFDEIIDIISDTFTITNK